MMELNDLQLFADIVRRGSFAAAAKARGVDPSTVSRGVSALEAELGVRLFQRSTRRNAPTEAGLAYFARIEPLIDELAIAAEAARDIGDAPSGRLRVTCSVTFGQMVIVPLLPAFRAAYPGLRLDLVATDANLDLIAERIDVAIRLGPRLDVGYIGAKLFDTRYKVCASPAYLATEGRPATPLDLADRSCLLLDLAGFRDAWRFRNQEGVVTEVPVRGDLRFTNAGAVRSCALAGLGPGLLVDWVVRDDLASGDLIDLFPDLQVTASDFETAAWILYPSRRLLPGKVRAFVDFLRANTRAPAQASTSIG
jgi:DNA-binding transcriptional LysR family regulator